MIQVEIWSDFVCPFCYIGKRVFEKALSASGLEEHVSVTYRAFELQPDGPTEPGMTVLEGYTKKAGISMEQAKQGFAQITQRAESLGLTYHFDDLYAQDTLKAHRVAKYAETKGKGKEFQERAFHAVFTENLFLAHTDELVSIAMEIGLDSEEVRKVADDSDAFFAAVKEEKRKGGLLGITSVPFFMFNEKYAIKGAQTQDTFEKVLKKAADDAGITPSLQTFGSDDDSCGPDGCPL